MGFRERLLSLVRSLNRSEVRACGRFKPNGSSAITNTQGSTVFGRGWSVAYVSTGKYTLSIDGNLGTFLHGDASLVSSTIADGGQFRINAVPSVSNGVTTVTIDHYGEDAAGVMQLEDIAAASGNFVTFELVFQQATETR